jgi:hypothetical protein
MIQSELELNIVRTVSTTLEFKHTLTVVKPLKHEDQRQMLAASHLKVEMDYMYSNELNQTTPQYDDGIMANALRVDIVEQTPQSDAGSNDEEGEETNALDIEDEANISIGNETIN